MKIDIRTETIEIVSKIVIDDKEYPLHKWNVKRATEYLNTGLGDLLKELKDFTLDFGQTNAKKENKTKNL